MSKVYSLMPLGEILTKSEEWIDINPIEKYKQVTVKIWGKGVVERNEVTGAEIAASKRLKVHYGQFILSRIDARHGAFGLIPNSLDGAIVTNDFPVFTPNNQKILPQFLDWMSKTKDFIELCKAASEGTTNRVRLKENKFLSMKIPLPPLEEQRRIVERVEELVGKFEEVRSLRQKALEETEALLISALNLTFQKNINKQGWKLKPLRQAAEVARGKFTHRPRNDPRFYGGNIPFIQIGDISNSNRYIREYSQTLNQEGLNISRMFPKGSIVIAITGATIGVTGILTFDSCFPDSIVGIVPNQDNVIPEFMYWSLEYVKKVALAEATKTTQPNINLQILDKLKIPVPPLPEQHRIVTYLDELQTKVDTMKQMREEAMKELDALLPSILDKAFKGEL